MMPTDAPEEAEGQIDDSPWADLQSPPDLPDLLSLQQQPPALRKAMVEEAGAEGLGLSNSERQAIADSLSAPQNSLSPMSERLVTEDGAHVLEASISVEEFEGPGDNSPSPPQFRTRDDSPEFPESPEHLERGLTAENELVFVERPGEEQGPSGPGTSDEDVEISRLAQESDPLAAFQASQVELESRTSGMTTETKGLGDTEANTLFASGQHPDDDEDEEAERLLGRTPSLLGAKIKGSPPPSFKAADDEEEEASDEDKPNGHEGVEAKLKDVEEDEEMEQSRGLLLDQVVPGPMEPELPTASNIFDRDPSAPDLKDEIDEEELPDYDKEAEKLDEGVEDEPHAGGKVRSIDQDCIAACAGLCRSPDSMCLFCVLIVGVAANLFAWLAWVEVEEWRGDNNFDSIKWLRG